MSAFETIKSEEKFLARRELPELIEAIATHLDTDVWQEVSIIQAPSALEYPAIFGRTYIIERFDESSGKVLNSCDKLLICSRFVKAGSG